jgi:hypothetical protein
VIRGTSGEFAELAGPGTFWVGKCWPELDERRIKEIIIECAESCSVKDFIVEDVKCLTKDPNPWTKSFKVFLLACFESAMLNPKMYLGTWEAQPFTKWPSRRMQEAATLPVLETAALPVQEDATPPEPGVAALQVTPGAAAPTVPAAAVLLVAEVGEMLVDSEAVSR